MFVANTNEAGTQRADRVRWSHPFSDLTGQKGVEDWRTNDWLQTPADGDQITGLASFNDELLIFKTNSVWALRGYGPESFQLENVSQVVGAIGQKAIAVGDEGVYFFSWPNGLQLYDGKAVRDLWYPLLPLTDRTMSGTRIDNKKASATFYANTTVGYVNQRAWVSLTTSGTKNDITFVYDSRLGKSGGWTRYDLPLGVYAYSHPAGDDRRWYAVCNTVTGDIHQLSNTTLGQTDFIGNVSTPIASNVYTRWFDEGNPALIKRWKKPIFVLDSNYTQTLPVSVYRDYDFTNAYRTFSLIMTTAVLYTWNILATAQWGNGTWTSAVTTGTQVIKKGGLLGRATSVALKISGPTAGNQPWAVNSITLKYLPKRIRS